MTEVSKYTDVIKRMVLERNRQLLALLMFIKKHENDEKGISRQKIANYMNAEDLSSRITTLNMINSLIQERVLIDDKSKNYQSNLKINPEFDFYSLLMESIYYQFKGMEKVLKPFEPLIKNKKIKIDFKRQKNQFQAILDLSDY
ncbi:MAG: hypothetical protein ACRD97_12165 [Nitrososphaeraceae archaeon]